MSAFFIVSNVYAGECTTIYGAYGGGITCPQRGEVFITKQVLDPITKNYVNNLTAFDNKFVPNDMDNKSGRSQIVFKITVKNTGNSTVDNIEVKDILPPYFTFVSGPGTLNKTETANGTLTFNVTNLAAGESRDYFVYGTIVNANVFSANQTCGILNRVQARATEERFSEATVQYCVEKGVSEVTKGGITKGAAPVVQVPKTGPEAILSFIGLSSIAGIGFYMRKKATLVK